MERKREKSWKSQLFEDKLWVFICYLSKMKTVSMFYNSFLLYNFYSLFLWYFVLVTFKFKHDKFFVRHSASISKFEWFEQPCLQYLFIIFCFSRYHWYHYLDLAENHFSSDISVPFKDSSDLYSHNPGSG